MKNKGFTLIELLVVVAIIGVLATVVLASLGTARNKAKISKTELVLNQIDTSIQSARINSDSLLKDMAASNVSSCTGDIRGVNDSSPCAATWMNSWDAIVNEHEPSMDPSSYYRDAWNSPYIIDPNEGNPGCTIDTISSAGPDGIVGSSDDVVRGIPFDRCS